MITSMTAVAAITLLITALEVGTALASSLMSNGLQLDPSQVLNTLYSMHGNLARHKGQNYALHLRHNLLEALFILLLSTQIF